MIYSGSFDNPAPVEIIQHDATSIVTVAGDWLDQTTRDFRACLRDLANDSRVRTCVVDIDSVRGQFNPSASITAVREFGRRKLLVAFVHNARGPALLVALAARGVFCSPTASVGQLGCWSSTGQWPEGHPTAARFNEAALHEAINLRPRVSPGTWRRLLFRSINGEQAEALGIVDLVKTSVAEVAATFDRSRTKK